MSRKPVNSLLALLLTLAPATSLRAAGQTGQWVPIGPAKVVAPPTGGFGGYNAVGRLTTIAVHPTNPQIIYAGSIGQLGHEGCGVWKTTNGGQTWIPIADGLPTTAVGAIAIDPSNPERIYVITADEGLFRSDDAGGSWTFVYGDLKIRSNTIEGDRVVLLVHPTSPNVLYLTSDDGILRSSDGGASWAVSLSAGRGSWLVMDPANPNVLYAAVIGKGIYKTASGGATGDASWAQQTQSPLPYDTIRTDLTTLLALSHPSGVASEVVYALVPTGGNNTPAGFDLFRTTDGASWTKRYSCAPSGGECFFATMTANPADWQRVYMGYQLLWVSQDGGDTFARVPPTAADENDRQPNSPHGDYWELTIDPSNPATLFAGSDGGIYRSTNHGAAGTWTFIGEGITNAEMYDLALANTITPRAISGTQDNGNILYSGGLVWDHIPASQIQGGDGGGVAVDPTDADRFYAVFDNAGTATVSLDGGGTFLDFSAGNTSRLNCAIWNMTFFLQIHPMDPQTLLQSCVRFWRTTTNTPPGSWSDVLSPPAGSVVRSAIDPTADIYYAGTSVGEIFAGVGGSGWQEVFDHPEPLSISDIKVGRNGEGTLYVAFAPPPQVDRNCRARAGTSRIYRLTRGTSGLAMNAVDITSDLSAGLCVNALALDPVVPRTLYAATNRGVYRGKSNTAGTSWFWQPYNAGLPPADVRDLEVHPITGHLFAATFGRSAFEVTPEIVVPVVIDITPGKVPNSIQPRAAGTTPVAILSTAIFDAPAEVNRQSLTFGRTGNETSLAFCSAGGEDVNADGRADLVCHFTTRLTGFQSGDTSGILNGLTLEGTAFTGSDSVRIVK
jgi:photosystem II stability/assembly factor-like uncharacterized protein